jgi:hypothetical protein
VSGLETAMGIHFDAERAKKDSSYNNVIIEFKAPGLFKGSKTSAKFKEATNKRLLPYIQREAVKADMRRAITVENRRLSVLQSNKGKVTVNTLERYST